MFHYFLYIVAAIIVFIMAFEFAQSCANKMFPVRTTTKQKMLRYLLFIVVLTGVLVCMDIVKGDPLSNWPTRID